jgi:cysteine desulfuration protein SufE
MALGVNAMDESIGSIPPRLQEIIEEFSWCEGREKLELLLEFSEKMPPLPEWLGARRDEMDQVHECMTPVSVYAELDDSGGMEFYFDVPPESPTVRGYAALLAEGTQGATPEAILGIPRDFYLQMGLHEVLSQQRVNGIAAILAHMKRLALKKMPRSTETP